MPRVNIKFVSLTCTTDQMKLLLVLSTLACFVAACGGGPASKTTGAETSPYVDVLNDARSAGEAATSVQSAQEELIKGLC